MTLSTLFRDEVVWRFAPSWFQERWMRALPHATVRTMPQAGHFLHEEAPHALVDAIRAVISPRVR